MPQSFQYLSQVETFSIEMLSTPIEITAFGLFEINNDTTSKVNSRLKAESPLNIFSFLDGFERGLVGGHFHSIFAEIHKNAHFSGIILMLYQFKINL